LGGDEMVAASSSPISPRGRACSSATARATASAVLLRRPIAATSLL
jgi:hypothetical protein